MAGIVSYCFFCGLAGPAGASCTTCLVTIPRPSPESPAQFGCPRCTAATALLPIGIAAGATIHACPGCHGMFVGARAWCTLVARPDLAQAIVAKLPARGGPPSALVRLLRCPACPREMERGRFGASSAIVIDVCVAHGMWLDAGEVVAVVGHTAYRARVGVHAARHAADAAESGSFDVQQRAAEDAATLRRAEASARRFKSAKRGGLILILALAAVRIAFFFGRGHNAAPPEISGAGESAASAATALRNH
jgi:Zn-finger nucleic acid-binding protein